MVKRRLWLGFWVLAGSSLARAQVQPQPRQAAASLRPLTAREASLIVNATRERDRQAGLKPDCSHLTHEVYALAGYPYPYASSRDLYLGTPNFVRVTKPQPGDLIVWRGHVGIVIDPVEHSFYSSVRSGLRTEFYDTPEWKARGPARFYRYTTAKRPTVVLAGNRTAKAVSGPPSTGTEPDFEDFHGSLPDSPRPMPKPSDALDAARPAPDAPPTRASSEIPPSMPVAAAQGKPSKTEIASALSELNGATGVILREQDFSQVQRKVIIYDDLTLDRANFKGKEGSVQAHIESRVTLVAERIDSTLHSETLRWGLVRVNDGWQVLAPKDSITVPRDVAIRMLAARLALLTQQGNESDGASLHEQGQIVRVLSALLN